MSFEYKKHPDKNGSKHDQNHLLLTPPKSIPNKCVKNLPIYTGTAAEPWGGQGHTSAKKLNVFCAWPTHVGCRRSSTQAGAGFTCHLGLSAARWLSNLHLHAATDIGQGGTQCKGLLSQETTSKGVNAAFQARAGKALLHAAVVPTKAHWT